MVSRPQRLAEAIERQQHRADIAQRRLRDAVFELRLETEELVADGALLGRLDLMEAMIARCRGAALRADIEGARLRGLLAQAALHAQ